MTPDSSDARTSTTWTLPFSAVQKDSLPLVGGKGANLGEMFRQGWPVPPGFCVTTHAFRLWLSQMETHEQEALFGSLQRLDCADTEALREAGALIRQKLFVPHDARAARDREARRQRHPAPSGDHERTRVHATDQEPGRQRTHQQQGAIGQGAEQSHHHWQRCH